MKIIGIDPGYDRLGIAVVEKASSCEKERLVHSECFTTSKKTGADGENAIYDRLTEVGQRIKNLIEKHAPDALAMETLFITKNQKTAMHVSEARGIIAYEARLHGLPVFEYSPPQIKVAITSDGRSDKQQMIKMIPLLIVMPADDAGDTGGKSGKKAKKHDDEYDAIAVALTCIASYPRK